MEELYYPRTDTRLPLIKLHDWATVGLRHRRLAAISFVGVLVGAAMGAFLLPPRYQSNIKILVKHERLDPLGVRRSREYHATKSWRRLGVGGQFGSGID